VTEPRWAQICASEAAVQFDTQACCVAYNPPAQSPIDGVYSYIASTIILGPQVVLDTNPALARLLLLGFVSSVDDYFRRVIAGVVSICPYTRERVSDKPVAFGAIDYYESAQQGLSLFENMSFASLRDVRTQTQNVLGWNISSPSLVAAIKKYELLCHMRHAATHAGGGLSSRNARELGMKSSGVAHQVVLNEGALQAAAAICTSVVRAYNRAAYRSILEAWIGNGLLVANWEADSRYLKPLYELFRSRDDDVAPKSAYRSFVSIRPAVLAAAVGQT
jgi:hypothetical protein